MTKWNGLERKPMRRVSSKQAEKNEVWSQVSDDRAIQTGGHCEWCNGTGTRDKKFIGTPIFLEGHHKVSRARGGKYEMGNSFVCHGLCHQEVTDNNIDVVKYPTRKDYENHLRQNLLDALEE